MNKILIDANIFLRYLTNDIPEKAACIERYFKEALEGKTVLVTNLLVIAELVWTLESYYGLIKPEIAEKISLILNTPNLEISERQRILNAIAIYVEKNIDFVDAYNAFFAKDFKIKTVMTYDKKHFDRIPWVERLSP